MVATAPPSSSRSLAVLRVPNFRRYVVAQLASGAGMWNQRVAELWLLLELTGDGLSLGLGTALRTAPAIFLARPAGYLADRYDRRTLLTLTQGARGVVGVAMTAIVLGGRPPLGLVYLLILTLGMVNALDGPMRRSFVRDVVDGEHLRAAAGLHTATISIGRIIGPLVAGIVIAAAGVEWAFAVSVVTATVAIAAVRSITPVAVELEPKPRDARAPVGHDDHTALTFVDVLVLLGVFSTLGWNVDVVLPVLADGVLGRGPLAFSGLVICLSVGTLLGSLLAAGRPGTGRTYRSMVLPLFAFCAALPLVVATESLVPIAAALVVAGTCGGFFLSASNAALQLTADPLRQGRDVATYSIVFTGSRAIGAPILGYSVDHLGARPAIVAVGVVTATFGAVAIMTLWRFGQPATDGAS